MSKRHGKSHWLGAASACGLAIVASGCGDQTGPSPAVGYAGAAQAGAAAPGGGNGQGAGVANTADLPAVERSVDEFFGLPTDAADTAPSWSKAASLGSVRGRVFDAQTGAAITGTISTDAACSGAGCSAGGLGTATAIEHGAFAFDAYAAKPASLTLSPTTKFKIEAKGFQSLVIAHGPKAAVQMDGEQSSTALPDVYLCPLKTALVDDDADKDGICDAAERRYGTRPDKKDTDDDDLSDSLELLGHPADDETTYDFASLGAKPVHKDIIVAVRYTQSSGWDERAFAPVITSFKAAPRDNPDQEDGIHLIVLFDDRAIIGADDLPNLDRTDYSALLALGQTPPTNNAAIWASFDVLARKYFGPRPRAFHYALIANILDARGTSGLSRDFGASDFVVTLGAFEHGTVTQQAGTFMHELGHNLGLHHGGLLQGGGANDDSFKAQYLSVMNYNYQFHEIERSSGKSFDYSRLQVGAFDEAHVDERSPFEPVGTTTTTDFATYLNPHVHVIANGQHDFPTVEGDLNGPLDLNRNGVIECDAQFNAYDERGPTSYGPIIDDWGHVALGGGPTGYVGDMGLEVVQRVLDWQEMPPCLSPVTAAQLERAAASRAADDTPLKACPPSAGTPPAQSNPADSSDTNAAPDAPADSAAADSPRDSASDPSDTETPEDQPSGDDTSADDPATAP